MKTAILILCLPLLAMSQPLQFQFQPDAFAVSVNGFQAYQPWAGGMDDLTPTFSDIDDDGDLDFFCGNQSAFVTLFTNVGDSTQPFFSYTTSVFDSLHVPVISYGHSDQAFADLDADGDLDALVGCGKILFYRNNGTATQCNFTQNPDTLLTTTGDYVIGNQLALVDMDSDGDMDFVGGDYWGYLKYYQNTGSPSQYTFQLISSNWFNTYTSEGYADPCFGDMDGDNDLDLLIGTGQGHVMYYRNDGTPTNPQMTPVSSSYLGISVQKDASPELADIDGDGDLDLFVGRSPNTGQSVTQGDVYFYRNEGTPQNPNFTYVTSNYLTWDVGGYARPLFADIDTDGDPDLVSRLGGHLIFYRNTGSPGNPAFTYESSNYGNISVNYLKPWLADVNGDGKLDLFAGTSAIPGPPGLKLYLNQGTPQVPNWVLYSNDLVPGVFNTYSVNLVPWTADIDADGDQDLFVTDDNGYLYYFRNTGTPRTFQFQCITNNWQDLNGGYPAHRYGCFYDMDGDNDLDLFMNYTAQVLPTIEHLHFYRNIGNPQDALMVLETNDLFPEMWIPNAAPFANDIDQDGDGDLFVGDACGGCRFFRNMDYHHPNPKRPVGPPEKQITILPGSAGTTISFVLPSAQTISLDVFNLLGAKVATLASGWQGAGSYSYTWETSHRASGIYLLRLETADQTVTQKIVTTK